ncbi:MAG: CvpA family protein [Chloroflexi bacterium]|nr:CvpA family protein [Chloroflexota bacterium]
MNWLDIVIIIAIALSVFSGLKNGIITAVISLAGLIVGVLLAGRYYLPLSERLTFIPQENIARIAAFAIIVIVVMIVAALAAGIAKTLIHAILLGWADHLLGGVFGLFMGGILWGALLAIWVKYAGMGQTIADSRLAQLLLDYIPLVLALLPGEFDSVRDFFK